MRALKRNVVQDKGSTDPAAAARLTTYEQDFAAEAQKQAAQAPVNSGSSDYMDDYWDRNHRAGVSGGSQSAGQDHGPERD